MADYDRLPTSNPIPSFPPDSPSSPPLHLQPPPSVFAQHHRLISGTIAALLIVVGLSQTSYGGSSGGFKAFGGELAPKEYLAMEQLAPVVQPVEEELRKFTWEKDADPTLEQQLSKLSLVRVPFFCFPFPALRSPSSAPVRAASARLALYDSQAVLDWSWYRNWRDDSSTTFATGTRLSSSCGFAGTDGGAGMV
jgi:hypothetical protein